MLARAALFAALGCACTQPKPNFADGGPLDAAADAGQAGDAGDAGTTCEPGRLDCDGDGSCETYGWAGEASCGACGRRCDATELCIASACRVPALAGGAIGSDFSCVLTLGGHVLCWGRDHRGQLGDGSYSETGEQNRHDAVAVIDLVDAVAIDAGPDATCAIRGEDRLAVVCWGNDNPERFGPALGARAVYPRPEPLVFDTPERAEQIAVGGTHLCVRTPSRVACAGVNAAGQLGRGDASLRTTVVGSVEGLPPGAPRSVAVSYATNGATCVVMDDGLVYCFGSNEDGLTGSPGGPPTVRVPTAVPGVSDAVDVVLGALFGCALDRAGAVFCWGNNSHGQLGNGTVGGTATAARVTGLPPIGAIVAGTAFVLAVSASGDEVWGWGEGSDGQLGRGPGLLEDTGVPLRLLGESGVRYEALAGSTHACLLLRRTAMPDELRCTGHNQYGQLGEPASAGSPVFRRVAALP